MSKFIFLKIILHLPFEMNTFPASDLAINILSDILNIPKVATVNRISHKFGPVPGLVQDDSNVAYCNAGNLPDKYDIAKDNRSVYHCSHRIELELDKVYEFLLIDDTTDDDESTVSHPIHMHGYAFEVLDMGNYEQFKSGKTAFRNAVHPPVIKDTVTIPRHGFVRIKVRTSNPGYWMVHCHIEHHLPIGMLAILKVGKKSDIPPPPSNFPTCGNFFMPINELFESEQYRYRMLDVNSEYGND